MVAVVVGGANVDVKAASSAPAVPATSNPGTTVVAPGGVGRNVAENLARLGTPVVLVAAVGDDVLGDHLVEATAAAGVDVTHVRRTAHRTGTYTAVLDADGELLVAVSDMAATDTLGPADLDAVRGLVAAADLLVLDGNLAPALVGAALDLAAATATPVVLEPVSVPKARRLAAELRPDRPVRALTPNADELAALTGHDDRRAAARALHDRGVELVWVRLGERGSWLSGPGIDADLPAVPAAEVRDVTGAGDAMLAAFCHAVLAGADPVAAARTGHAAAALTVASPHT
ncbi:MAG TPA: carbohydrate kinase family protein, partial [Acidimicrobiales bacterium]